MKKSVPLLVIDDYRPWWDLLRRQFQTARISNELHFCASYSATRAYFDLVKHGREQKPGLILLDIVLPNEESQNIMQFLMQEHHDIPVLGYSALDHIPHAFRQAGMIGLIRKDHDVIAQLLHLIARTKLRVAITEN